MQKTSMVLGALTSLAAGVTGVMAYGAFAPSAPAPASSPVAVATAAPGAAPTAQRPRVRYRPCPLGARVEDGVCVTRVVHTVVVPAPAGRSQVARRASASHVAEPADVDGGDDTPGTEEESDDDDSAEDESGDVSDEDGGDGDHEEADDDGDEDGQEDAEEDGDQDEDQDEDEHEDVSQDDGGGDD